MPGRACPSSTLPRAIPTSLPQPLAGIAKATCANAPAGWLAREVSRPGQFHTGALRASPAGTQTYGYLDRAYAVCGEQVGLHLSSSVPATAAVEAIRLGSYGRMQGRVVKQFPAVQVRHQESVPPGSGHTQDNDWPVSLYITPDASWPPGPYALRIVTNGSPGSATHLPFYVQSTGTPAAYLVVSADLTHLAYNSAGGVSLYRGPGATTDERRQSRATTASARRPYDFNGLKQWIVKDVPLATFLDRHRITVDWTTDSSLDADPRQVSRHATVVLPGHSEYWTRRNYDTLEYAVAHGTNLASLGGNELYWQTRLVRDPKGNLWKMIVYRFANLDPAPADEDKTVQWRDPILNRDPARLTGLGMSGVGVGGPGTVVTAPAWLFSGSGVGIGARLPWLYGNEADRPEPPGGNSPANLQVLLRGAMLDQYGKPVVVGTGYYSAPSGAGVFNAGTTEWLCGIDNTCPGTSRPAVTRRALDAITLNVLRAFATPRAGVAHPSIATPWTQPTPRP